MSDGRFQGWYYKQRTGDYMLAFIPAAPPTARLCR